MKITTANEMRAIDRRAAGEYHVPRLALMQAAGAAFAQACVEVLGGRVAGKRVTMVCGPGNNGGDGFVAARHLANAGAHVGVFLAARPSELQGDAALFFAPLGPMGISVVEIAQEASVLFKAGSVDLIGDALFGTGVHGAVTGAAARLIEALNVLGAAGVPVVAADIPSGVDADTGAVAGPAVRATHTVTFALPKLGLLLYPGADYVGRLSVADIGIPRALLAEEALQTELTTQTWMRQVLPARVQTRDTNKGTFGTVLVIAGSAGMVGAAALTATAALRAGAGLVQLAVPQSVLDGAALLAPEVITKGLPETSERTHGGPGALQAALALAQNVDAVALGPGLGQNDAARDFVCRFVAQLPKPLVIDADGLNAVAENPAFVQGRGEPTVLTPHPGEMGRLLNTTTQAVQTDRRGAAQRCAERFNAVALLKGARTLLANPDGRLAVNRPGSPALATAGSGDVLTGVIAALLAQRLNGFDAGRAGAYLHALAGERAAHVSGTTGVIASDVRDQLPFARAALYEETLTDL